MEKLRPGAIFLFSIVLFVGLLLASVVLVVWLHPTGEWEIKLRSTEVAQGFGILVLVALFVERASEVGVGVFRDPKRREAQSALFAAQEMLADARRREDEVFRTLQKREHSSAIDPKEMLDQLKVDIAQLIDEVNERYQKFNEADEEAEFKASILSVLIAFFVALTGITALNQFFEFECKCGTCNKEDLFDGFRTGVDVVLTTLLIGGGAKGIRAIWRSIGGTIGSGQGSFRGR